MTTETHTGRLIFGDGQVDMEDGTVLAVAGNATPFATAVALYERWGQTQPVTVTGMPGTIDNTPVLFVTNIRWADEAPAQPQSADFLVSAAGPPPVSQPVAASKVSSPKRKTVGKKAAAARAARSGSKK